MVDSQTFNEYFAIGKVKTMLQLAQVQKSVELSKLEEMGLAEPGKTAKAEKVVTAFTFNKRIYQD
jgi:hypothetical protein